MKELEARAFIECETDYCEDDIDEIMDIYRRVVKHIGFEDKRSDKRYVVKFHDIIYCAPDGLYDEDEFIMVFNDFCRMWAGLIEDTLADKHIYLDSILHNRCLGSYQPFILGIPRITEDNSLELSIDIFDEFGWKGIEYVDNYVEVVNELQDLEDNYMEYWLEHIEENKFFTKKQRKYFKDKYIQYVERRNAK